MLHLKEVAFAMFTRKHFYWSHFEVAGLQAFKPVTLSKRDSSAMNIENF